MLNYDTAATDNNASTQLDYLMKQEKKNTKHLWWRTQAWRNSAQLPFHHWQAGGDECASVATSSCCRRKGAARCQRRINVQQWSSWPTTGPTTKCSNGNRERGLVMCDRLLHWKWVLRPIATGPATKPRLATEDAAHNWSCDRLLIKRRRAAQPTTRTGSQSR